MYLMEEDPWELQKKINKREQIRREQQKQSNQTNITK
jgi:hypothetical protein